MTPVQFQQVHGEWLKTVLNDPKGQALLNVLASLQPVFPTSEIPHLFSKGVGEREGFERCIKMLVGLCNVKVAAKEPEINYGVPDAPEKKD